ncbi:MAG: 50S ribosomal protein L4 [Chloroflexi bacterium]|nr:50S ribosomal protein L4 [Chloroflexota bacterium]
MEAQVKNQQGVTIETVELNDAVFAVPMNQALVHQALVTYLLNKRQGTHDTKTRGEVSGGGRKPWVQKHTGRARQGSIRSPQWRHGGVVFGPHPRSYRRGMTRRTRRQALKCVLSEKARQQHLIFIDSLDTINGKTKSMVDLLNSLGISGSALMVTREPLHPMIKAAHNLQKVWTLPVTLLNAQELLSRETVIMTLEAARWAEETLAVEPHGRRGSGGRSKATLVDVVADDVAEDLESEAEEIAVAGQSDGDRAVDSLNPTEESEATNEAESQGDV